MDFSTVLVEDVAGILGLLGMCLGILATVIPVRRLVRTRTRPENDPYADTEFGENGTPLKPDQKNR